MKNLLRLLFVLMVFGCNHEPAISVNKVSEFSARKTYGYLNDEQHDSVKTANPEMQDHQLEKAGLIKDGHLLVEKFAYCKSDFELKNTTGKVVKAKCSAPNDTLRIIFTTDYHSVEVKFSSPFTQYCIANVIPGGYQEIIALDQSYVANGDNFEVTVYEVKTGN